MKEAATCRTGEFDRGHPFSSVWYGDCRNSTGDLGTDKRFTGQRLDDTGLYYYSARYYDPTIGRFISADTFIPWSTGYNVVSRPLTVNAISTGLGSINAPQGNYPAVSIEAPVNPQTLNRYTYVLNNPLRYTDPFGWWTFGFGVNFFAGFGGGGVSTSIMIVVDGHGNWAVATTPSGGGAGSGGSLSACGQFQGTGADNVYQLEGPVSESGFSFSTYGISGGGEGIVGLGDNPYGGANINVGFGIGTPEVHSFVGYTEVDPFSLPWGGDKVGLPVNNSSSNAPTYDPFYFDYGDVYDNGGGNGYDTPDEYGYYEWYDDY